MHKLEILRIIHKHIFLAHSLVKWATNPKPSHKYTQKSEASNGLFT